jgi:hypothetical protein
MRGTMRRIGVLSMLGVFLALAFAWAATSQPCAGEAVPDNVAASLSGGGQLWKCEPIKTYNCKTLPFECFATVVFVGQAGEPKYRPPDCEVYCGIGNMCVKCPKNGILTTCDTN